MQNNRSLEIVKYFCESIDKNGMKYPIIVCASDYRVLRGNQRVWYAIDNGLKCISCYRIRDSEIDKWIQKTYINREEYP